MNLLAQPLRHLAKLLPPSVSATFRVQRDRLRLARVPRVSVASGAALVHLSEQALATMFADSSHLADEWTATKQDLEALGITDRADGINPGDRRALYYLIRHFSPKSVLEVGTHIGASTAHIAAALSREPAGRRIVTVDISDVNDPVAQPWRSFGATRSPRELISMLGMNDAVEFVTKPSLHFLRTTSERFDFIFLDGDHSAPTVYQEIPAALSVLNPGGVILLHDFFPNMKPLWRDGHVIPGGCMAVERLISEGASIRVVALGDLPWPTKQGSQRTSLALVARA